MHGLIGPQCSAGFDINIFEISIKNRVLTRILKIGVKCCPPEKVGVLPYLSIETFQKVGVRNEKLE